MIQQSVQIERPPSADARQEFEFFAKPSCTSGELQNPRGFAIGSPVFQNYQKYGLLILLAGILYFRLVQRKRRNDRICPRCGHRNQPHISNCAKCGSPLMDLGRGNARRS